MTDSKPQESCITRIKKWFIAFYKAPCFWLKAIPLVILIGLAAIGLYQIVTSAFHYFSEPLSYFDPERLGQLGDFLGGTLNPIFGFLTVCILVWSIFIQRKELSETRRQLEKQVSLATNEYNRKHILDLLNAAKETFNKNLHLESNYKLRFFYERKTTRENSEIPEYSTWDAPIKNQSSIFDIYKWLLNAEKSERSKLDYLELLNDQNTPLKRPLHYTISVILTDEMGEYSSNNQLDLGIFIDIRRSALNMANLYHRLIELNDDETIKKILIQEALDLLNIQTYFVEKADIAFVKSLPDEFQYKIQANIKERKFDYKISHVQADMTYRQ